PANTAPEPQDGPYRDCLPWKRAMGSGPSARLPVEHHTISPSDRSDVDRAALAHLVATAIPQTRPAIAPLPRPGCWTLTTSVTVAPAASVPSEHVTVFARAGDPARLAPRAPRSPERVIFEVFCADLNTMSAEVRRAEVRWALRQ